MGAFAVGGSGYFFYLVTLLFFQAPWKGLIRRFAGRGGRSQLRHL